MWKHAEDRAIAQFSKSIQRDATEPTGTMRLSRNSSYVSRFSTVQHASVRRSEASVRRSQHLASNMLE